ncbi:MAG: YkgJ family cysteine cluster protein [Alphaproteobacteria bacterium]|nr:YkgJ family cysteine cluster protein [Alphaproteobacteria bacterium]
MSTVRIPVTLQTPAGPLTVALGTTEEKVPVAAVMAPGAELADALGEVVVKLAEQHGTPVQCRKGCGHCCRQLVPVSPIEAFALKDAYDALPADQRARIAARFDAVRERLRETGMDARIADIQPGPEGRQVVLDYFALGNACPFLEDEACQVYASRPFACRDLLVASDPDRCADPGGGGVRRLPVLMDLGRAMRSVSAAVFPDPPLQIPLPQALAWAEQNDGLRGTVARGVDLVKGLLSALAAQARG